MKLSNCVFFMMVIFWMSCSKSTSVDTDLDLENTASVDDQQVLSDLGPDDVVIEGIKYTVKEGDIIMVGNSEIKRVDGRLHYTQNPHKRTTNNQLEIDIIDGPVSFGLMISGNMIFQATGSAWAVSVDDSYDCNSSHQNWRGFIYSSGSSYEFYLAYKNPSLCGLSYTIDGQWGDWCTTSSGGSNGNYFRVERSSNVQSCSFRGSAIYNTACNGAGNDC